MKQRNALCAFLLGAGTASGLLTLPTCTDYTTGQDGEVPGPLEVLRLTLFDPSSGHGGPVFTDTAAPADCEDQNLKDTPACTATPFKDTYGVVHSPPNPDSGSMMRVVFNKAPLKINGKDVEPVPTEGLPRDITELKLDPSAIRLVCNDSCTAVPPYFASLQLTGSDQSPDPTVFPYGPALQLEIGPEPAAHHSFEGKAIAADPLRALEPGARYSIELSPGLSGRNAADKLNLSDRAKALLTFITEPFQPLQVGIGDYADTKAGGFDDTTDPFILQSADIGDGSESNPYTVSGLPNNGAIALALNAGVDASVFRADTATATVSFSGDGMERPVAVLLGNGLLNDRGECEAGNQRRLYVAPAAGGWADMLPAGQTATVTVKLIGANLRDVSQEAGHPAGKGLHTLPSDLYLRASKLSGPNPQHPILHFDGTTWTRQDSGTDQSQNAVFGFTASDIWAVGSRGTLTHYNGTTWTAQGVAGGANIVFSSVSGNASGSVWAVGASGNAGVAYKWNGTAWGAQTLPAQTPALTAVYAASANSAWAVGGDGTIVYFNGTAWAKQTPATAGARFTAVFGSDATHVWAVGSLDGAGVVNFYDGTTWTDQTRAMAAMRPLAAVWAANATSAFAVGSGGAFESLSGSAWAMGADVGPANLYGLFGTSKTNLYAVGAGGTFGTWNGTEWKLETEKSAETVATWKTLRAVWAATPNDIWAVGDVGQKDYDGALGRRVCRR